MIALLRRFDVGAQIALLALLAVYFMVWPVWRAGFPIEIAQNEGWNAYHADAAMGAAPLYPATDTLVVNNYPPLSFYVVGELAKLTGIDALYVGRAMSLIAVVALGGLIAKVISQLGGGRAGAALGGIWYVAVMARSFTRFVGMNDPQLVGHALMVAALAWFLARDMRKQSAVPPFLAMAAIGFYKHNIIAVPVTAFLWLLVQDWRRAVWPAIAGCGRGRRRARRSASRFTATCSSPISSLRDPRASPGRSTASGGCNGSSPPWCCGRSGSSPSRRAAPRGSP